MTVFSLKKACRWTAALAIALAACVQPVQLAEAAGETRSLKLYFIHTGEKATITFKRNGKFDPKGLQEINRFLRDWRRNEPTRMDPRLFDLVWEVYNKVGASDYIHVVSAYRSPTTNAMLRSRTKGVAETSQHMRGKAMDFYIPGIPLKTLRETAMKYQRGGVGFYPTSRSPFVHLDVAGVRAWPRMPRDELVKLFPNGKTLHIPADGKPLPGYEQALAEYKSKADTPIEIAENKAPAKRRNFLSFLFGGGDEDEDADAIAAPAEAPAAPAAPAAPTAPAVAPPVMTASAEPAPADGLAALRAPVPATRPALASTAPQASLMTALTPPPGTAGNAAIQALQQETAQTGFADLGNYRIPVPSLLTREDAQAPQLAFVPVPSHRPGEPVAPPVETASVVPATRPAPATVAEPHETEATQVPANGNFRPSTSVMMGTAEPLRAPATLRNEAERMPSAPHAAPRAPAAQSAPETPAVAVAQIDPTPVRAGKAARVAAPVVPVAAPVKEEPRIVPVYGFDPKRF